MIDVGRCHYVIKLYFCQSILFESLLKKLVLFESKLAIHPLKL